MEFEGKVWKDGKFWLIEVPPLNVMTQGRTQKKALYMLKDAIEGLMECYFSAALNSDFSVTVNKYTKGIIGVTSNDTRLLLAFSLKKQREKSGSTIREVSERLGSKSPNAYAQYERGSINISLDKYEMLLSAANPADRRYLRVI